MNDDAVVEAVVFNEPIDNNMAAADSEAKEMNVAAAPELVREEHVHDRT